ncbi:cytochrome P450 6j1-like [Sitophilus oryzae]|uniref:Cytochrome P450 6j1-like n=1 Tax=Sitophilus oryzae TaxID=7048 RepID=A0A6J2XLN6_SITOR|nr:cytochrome P450 6j1-like [Sitophilus oryzae]
MLLNLLLPNWITIFLFLLILLLCYSYITRNDNYWKIRNVPYEKPYFLVGNFWEVFSGKKQIGKHLGHLYNKFTGPYFGIFVWGKPYLVIRGPDIIKQITIRDFNNFVDRTFACDKEADDMSGNSLFIIRNPDWRNIRNKLSSIFTSGKIKNMYPLMVNTAENLQKYLENFDNEILEIKEVSGKYMTDLVASCFFGIESNSFTGKEEAVFRRVCREMFEMDISQSFRLFSYFFVPKLVSLFKFKLFDTSYFRQVFLETLSEREKSGIKRNDFVDLLIHVRDMFQEDEKNGTKFDTTCMVAQAITFFTAGFETTSNLLAFALYELSLRQDCQKTLREEIYEYFPDSTASITFDKIQQMQYLDMVLSETLRRYPFGPFLNRNCKEDYVIEETGLKIEKGTAILIPIDGLHFDPVYFPEPDKFEPERFRDGTKTLSNSCVYMPFGMGPRNCIGDRFGQICAKVGLVHFLRKFKVEKCHLTQEPLVLDPKSPFITPIHGLQLKIKKV